MNKYRKKPMVIEAKQWLGGKTIPPGPHSELKRTFFGRWKLRTLEGWCLLAPGDWIIRGVKGEWYPCKPDIFDLTYEPA